MEQRMSQLALGIWVLGCLVLLVLSLRVTDGMLVYTLDDPYIHLAVAQEMLAGGYGVNAGELASPSSSILYPFLLLIGLLTGLASLTPFVTAMIGQGVAVWLLGRVAAPFLGRLPVWGAGLVLAGLILTLNGYALPFTGLEHSWHVAASMLVLIGLWHRARGEPVPWLVAALVICALLRFEGFALVGMVVICLTLIGERRTAIIAAALTGGLLLAFMTAMYLLDLPLLPSSVMVKSPASAAVVDADYFDFLRLLWSNATNALTHRWGIAFALGTVFGLGVALFPSVPKPARVVGLAMAGALAAHLLIGRYGWFGRYQVYGCAILVTGAFLILQSLRAHWLFAVPLVAVAAVLARGYVYNVTHTPRASQGIYEQHYQMHRFATEYFPYPVAANDIGYLSYNNETYVLDLWGLASDAARRLRLEEGMSAQGLSDLVQDQGAIYAMIYPVAFAPHIPPEWCHVATLETSKVTAAFGEVAFYAIDPAYEPEMRAALAEFAPSLPEGATLSLHVCEA